jgi:signal peptidase I
MSRKLRLAIPLALLLAALPAYVRAYSLSGASAKPTVLVGDKFLINHAAYDLRLPYSDVSLLRFANPRRGDIVFARLPLPGGETKAIKRVMGLPGETIELRENRVLINGNALALSPLPSADFGWVPNPAEVFATEDGHWIMYTPGRGSDRNHAPVKLGPDEFYLLGDNRDDSLDSRSFGPIARDRIVGKMLMVYYRPRR